MSFYLTLPSFVRPEYPNNKPNHYSVRLPTRLNLVGQWKVGLASITLPSMSIIAKMEARGIQDNDILLDIRYKTEKSGGVNHVKTVGVTLKELKEQQRYFKSGADFFNCLKNIIDRKRFDNLDPGEKVISDEYVPLTIKQDGDDYEMVMGSRSNIDADQVRYTIDLRLCRLMRWIKEDAEEMGPNVIPDFKDYTRPLRTGIPTTNSTNLFKVVNNTVLFTQHAKWRFVHLNRFYEDATHQGARTLYVYSNVGKSITVGDQVVALLREVQYIPKLIEKFHFEPSDIMYHEVMQPQMDILEVQITETDNSEVNFGSGDTALVLHFKKE